MGRFEPKQVRGREAERKFVEAAEQVFTDKGYAAARVADIVKLAGSSTGNFYYRFKNKEALFDYMLEQYLERTLQSVQDLPPRVGNIADLIVWMIEHNAHLLNSNIGFYRAINEVSIRNPETWLLLRNLTEQVAQILLTKAAGLMHEIPDPKPQVRLQQVVQFITGSMANQAIHHVDRELDHPDNIEVHFRAAIGILGICPMPSMPSLQK